MAAPQPFFGDYVSARSNNNQRPDTSSNPHFYPGAESSNIPITAAPADTYLNNPVAWSHPHTAMPASTMGSTIEVFGRPGSDSSKSPSPGHHRYATRTPSMSSSSNKSSRSRGSTSSKSSAPSEPATKRRTRSSITTNPPSSTTTTSSATAAAPSGNKRDKFLERNRIAASKCRQRKKQWVNGLEEAKNGLENQNSQLQMEYNSLLGEVSRMKNQIMSHATCHDPNIDKWIDNEARRFVQGAPESGPPDFQGGGVAYGAFADAQAAPPFPMDYNGFGDEGE